MARRRRSASRRRKRRSRSPRRPSQNAEASDAGSNEDEGIPLDDSGEPYRLEILTHRDGPAMPMFDIQVEECAEPGAAIAKRILPHICANLGGGYAIRVTNSSPRHIACAVTVDGENALLRDGSLIVAPRDTRILPGFLVSKNFVGREYVKEFRDFKFGKPKVIEQSGSVSTSAQSEDNSYVAYGRILCEVFEAVLDEEIDSDQELRGQTSFYRGAGLNGSFEDRLVPEGKKKHFLYSSVTVQGARSSIANSTRGRWWVRGENRINTLEVRYREAHSLMLLGVAAEALGLARCKEEGEPGSSVKDEKDDKLLEKIDKQPGGQDSGYMNLCDLTADVEEEGADSGAAGAVWSVVPAPSKAEAVDC